MTGGIMYGCVIYTWNPLAGACLHDCEYCYVKALARRFPQLRKKYTGTLKIDEKALNQNLPRDRIIFVCSMNDLFAEGVPDEYIRRILEKTRKTDGRYLFQTKNPRRMIDYIEDFPPASIFATTIESNRAIVRTNAPTPEERMKGFLEFKEIAMDYELSFGFVYEITIEPIMVFDFHILTAWIEAIEPDFVSIGADSKRNNLPEPSEEDVVDVVRYLGKFTDVRLKKNLKRIAPSLFKEADAE